MGPAATMERASVSGRPRCRLGFVTSEAYRELTPDDRSGVPALSGRGIEVVPVVWTESLPAGLDALVLRSTWDYHLRLPDFLRWVEGIEQSGIRLLNPPPAVRWNVDKKYLLEIEPRAA